MKKFIQKLPDLNAGGTLIMAFITGMILAFSLGHFSGSAKANGNEIEKCMANNSKSHQELSTAKQFTESAINILQESMSKMTEVQKNNAYENEELRSQGL